MDSHIDYQKLPPCACSGTEVVALALSFRHVNLLPGEQQKLYVPGFFVILNQSQLHEVYGRARFSENISFARSILLCAHRGLCPTGGFVITIRELRLLQRDLIACVETRDPGPDTFVTLAATYPIDVVAVERAKLGTTGSFRAVFTSGGNQVAVVPFVI